MAAIAVSPSTVGSPGQDQVGTSSPSVVLPATLFDTVHPETCAESDWMNYYDQPPNEDELYLLAEELAKQQFPGGISNNDRPKWKFDSTGENVTVTFGEAKERMWTIAKDEIKAYRECVQRLSGKKFEDMDVVEDVLKLYLGRHRPLIQLMESSLGLSYEKVCHFLGTYCVQKAYRLSVSEMYDEDEDDRFRTLDLMSLFVSLCGEQQNSFRSLGSQTIPQAQSHGVDIVQNGSSGSCGV